MSSDHRKPRRGSTLRRLSTGTAEATLMGFVTPGHREPGWTSDLAPNSVPSPDQPSEADLKDNLVKPAITSSPSPSSPTAPLFVPTSRSSFSSSMRSSHTSNGSGESVGEDHDDTLSTSQVVTGRRNTIPTIPYVGAGADGEDYDPEAMRRILGGALESGVNKSIGVLWEEEPRNFQRSKNESLQVRYSRRSCPGGEYA